MGWKDNLQPATLAGAPFEVESAELTLGRRVQTHEYPGRDKPYTEELGRAARKVSIEAFLVGDDFMAKRDKLLAVLESGGAHELVHPWHGRMTVNVDGDCRVRHGAREGRYCAVSISLVESGELAFPTASASTGAQSLLGADALKTASIDDFMTSFSLDGMPEFGVTDAVSSATSMMGKLDGALLSLGGVLKSPARLIGDVTALLYTPQTFAQRLFGLFNSGSSFISLGDRRDLQRTQATVGTVGQFPTTARSASTTPTRTRMLDNRDALATLVRRTLLVQASGMSAAVPVRVYDDGAALRSGLTDAIEAESYTANDTVYPVLQSLRVKTHSDLTTRLRDSAKLRDVTPREVVPALVLAYDLYEQPARDDEIVARNKLRHPGFVPAEKIMVVSR
ncbi:MAG: DNA circularization N-terminal domain-containing protein [Gallionella sp.]|nr:DNA circularization N-terminal domain-containing protein [Gallionella sp.]